MLRIKEIQLNKIKKIESAYQQNQTLTRMAKKIPLTEFHPFTKDLHKFLISEGYNRLNGYGYIPDIPSAKEQGVNVEGYALLPAEIIGLNDTNEEALAAEKEIHIARTVKLPKDKNDIAREEILKESTMFGLVEQILEKFGADDGEDCRLVGWLELAPPDISITEKAHFGIRADKVYEMLNSTDPKFYIMLDVGYLKAHRLLSRKIKKLKREVASIPKIARYNRN